MRMLKRLPLRFPAAPASVYSSAVTSIGGNALQGGMTLAPHTTYTRRGLVRDAFNAARNPARYNILMYRMNNASQFREAVQSDKRFPAYRIPPQNKPIVEPYPLDHYRVACGSDRGFRFLERKDSPTTLAVPPARSEVNRQ